MTWMRALIPAFLLIASLSGAHAAPMDSSTHRTLLQEGQSAFDQGTSLRLTDPAAATASFQMAAQRWNQLIDDGVVNGPLLYDLGNAYVLSGDLGRGIAAYLRAQRLMPGDPRLAENLAHARTQVKSQFERSDGSAMLDQLIGWLPAVSPWTRLILFIVAWSLFWTALIMRHQIAQSIWRPWCGSMLALSILAGSSVVWSAWNGTGTLGVLIADDVVVRKGDAASFAPRFAEPIGKGVEFRILESRPVWLHVEFPNGDEGWVPRESAEVVAAPGTQQART